MKITRLLILVIAVAVQSNFLFASEYKSVSEATSLYEVAANSKKNDYDRRLALDSLKSLIIDKT